MTLRLRFCPLQRLRWVSVGPAVSLRIHRKPPKCNGLLVSSFPQKCKHPGLLQFVDTINVRVEGAVENQCERERERDAIYRNLHACAKRGTSLTHAHAVGTCWVVMRQFDRFVGPDCPVPFIIPPLHHRPRKVFGWFSHGCQHRCSTISTETAHEKPWLTWLVVWNLPVFSSSEW